MHSREQHNSSAPGTGETTQPRPSHLGDDGYGDPDAHNSSNETGDGEQPFPPPATGDDEDD